MLSHDKFFNRIFQSGDIIRVTSFMGDHRDWDIAWIAVVVEHKKPEELWHTAQSLRGPCKLIWISGEDDEENFQNYFNGSKPHWEYGRGPHDRGYIDYLDPRDSRLYVQLIDKAVAVVVDKTNGADK